MTSQFLLRETLGTRLIRSNDLLRFAFAFSAVLLLTVVKKLLCCLVHCWIEIVSLIVSSDVGCALYVAHAVVLNLYDDINSRVTRITFASLILGTYLGSNALP